MAVGDCKYQHTSFNIGTRYSKNVPEPDRPERRDINANLFFHLVEEGINSPDFSTRNNSVIIYIATEIIREMCG